MRLNQKWNIWFKSCNAISGEGIVKKLKPFSLFGEEVLFEFKLSGVSFSIWEPFNDSSRFWIGHEPPLHNPLTKVVKQ